VRVTGPIAAIALLDVSGLGCNAVLGIEDKPLRSSSSPYAEAVMADAPLLYLRFGESGGAVARDEKGRYDGRYPTSGITLGYAGAIAGDPDTAVSLDGTEGIAMPSSADFSTMQSFTVEVWVRPAARSAGGIGFVVDHETFEPERGGWDLAAGPKTLFERWIRAGDGISETGDGLAAESWHYLVATFDASSERLVLWIDGAPLPGVSHTVAIPAVPQGWMIGAQNCACPGNDFAGAVDELAIYGSVLPDARIQAHFAAAR
jgi:hypothetical protein